MGRGAYGEVWLARSVTGVHRAVKIVRRANFSEDRPFDREFAGIQRFEPVSLGQDSQVGLLHVGRNDAAGFFYYVMELADDIETGDEIFPDVMSPRRSRNCAPGSGGSRPASVSPSAFPSRVRWRICTGTARPPRYQAVERDLRAWRPQAGGHRPGLGHRHLPLLCRHGGLRAAGRPRQRRRRRV